MVYEKNPKIMARKINGVPYLIDDDESLRLNEVGKCIWKLIDGSRSPKEITQLLIEDFDAPFECVYKDVESFLQMLRQEGYVLEVEITKD